MKEKVPRRPKTLSYHYERDSESLTLREKKTLKKILAADGGYMLAWMGIWSVGCAALIAAVIDTPSIFRFCVAIPVWAIWVLVFCPVMAIWFGRKTVRLDEDGLRVEYRVVFRLTSQRVTLGEIQCFLAVSDFVEAVTEGKPVEFSAAGAKEARWLAQEMNWVLAELRGEVKQQPGTERSGVTG